LDSIAQLPKYIGGGLSLGGVAFAVSNIIHTIKRIFVVMYPPLIALYLLNGNLSGLFILIYICYFGSALVTLIVYYKKEIAIKLIARQIEAFGNGGSLWKAWTWPKATKFVIDLEFKNNFIDRKIYISALIIYFFFGSVFFLINILGFKFNEYASVILQTTGLFNSIGTLILAFYLDPVLARVFERHRERSALALRSVMWAQITNFGLISPVFFYLLSILIL